jgi:hypothetical protein
MTRTELMRIEKVYQYGISKACTSNEHQKEHVDASNSGDTVKAEVMQRLSDEARGEALGIAHALALIFGTRNCNQYSAAIYHELGED